MTRTLIVWRAVRVIGYGAHAAGLRPARRTPGYQEGIGLDGACSPARGRMPAPPADAGAVLAARVSCPRPIDIPDANQGTFYRR